MEDYSMSMYVSKASRMEKEQISYDTKVPVIQIPLFIRYLDYVDSFRKIVHGESVPMVIDTEYKRT